MIWMSCWNNCLMATCHQFNASLYSALFPFSLRIFATMRLIPLGYLKTTQRGESSTCAYHRPPTRWLQGESTNQYAQHSLYKCTTQSSADSSTSMPLQRPVRSEIALRKRPWYNTDIAAAKRKRRRLERKWLSNGKSEIDRKVLCVQKNVVNTLLKKAKRSYYVGLIEDCGDDSRQLFSVANRLLNRKQSSPFQSHTDSSAMAETFIKYFRTKVKTISDSLCPDESSHKSLTSASLEILKPTDPDEILSLLRRLPPKSCPLDPVPTILLKDCSSTFAPIISLIVNLSIDQANVPSCLKTAYMYITPLLKKTFLGPRFAQYLPPSV